MEHAQYKVLHFLLCLKRRCLQKLFHHFVVPKQICYRWLTPQSFPPTLPSRCSLIVHKENCLYTLHMLCSQFKLTNVTGVFRWNDFCWKQNITMKSSSHINQRPIRILATLKSIGIYSTSNVSSFPLQIYTKDNKNLYQNRLIQFMTHLLILKV